jgi:hypothetical protein
MYQRLWNILDTTAVQQAESSLQHLVEASVLTPGHPKNGGGGKGLPKGLWAQGLLPNRQGNWPTTA